MGEHNEVILLDTHVLVWLATEPAKLSKHASSAVRRASRAGGVGISAISLWELAWLATHGRLLLTGTVERIAARASRKRTRTLSVPGWKWRFVLPAHSVPDRRRFPTTSRGLPGRLDSRASTALLPGRRLEVVLGSTLYFRMRKLGISRSDREPIPAY
jgi:PIN domain nuclease of toxin-antitoxin system